MSQLCHYASTITDIINISTTAKTQAMSYNITHILKIDTGPFDTNYLLTHDLKSISNSEFLKLV